MMTQTALMWREKLGMGKNLENCDDACKLISIQIAIEIIA